MSVKLYSTSALYIVPLVLIIVLSFFLTGTFEYSGKGIVVPTTPSPTGGAGGGPTTAPTTFPQTAVISLLPATVSADSGTGSVTVSLDAKEAQVNAVTVEIDYEEDKLRNVEVTAAPYLPGQQEVVKTVANGKITLSIIPALASETLPTGVGTVATISFSPISSASPPTTLAFSNNTTAYAVGSSGQNIILTREPATITW